MYNDGKFLIIRDQEAR